MPHVHRVVVDAHVRVGARYETAKNNGLSHLLEHMLYRGTRRHPSAHDQALAFERLGGSLGAATYVDHGTLAVAVPRDNWEKVLDLVAEVVREPLLESLDIERGIVREEILENLDERGACIDPDAMIRELAFPGHGLGLPITGTLGQLERFVKRDLVAHHRNYYTARNMVVVVAGPIDPERALRSVGRAFAALPAGRAPRAATPKPQRAPRWRYVKNPSSQTALRLAFRAPSERDGLEPATEMLLRVLDDGLSTRLYHRLCDERGLCYDVSAVYEAYTDAGLFDIAVNMAHQRARVVLSEVFDVLTSLSEHGPDRDELDKAKRRYSWQLNEMHDHPDEAAEFFGLGELTEYARTPRERAESLGAVTVDDVRSAAEQLFARPNLNALALGVLPKSTQDQLSRRVLEF